MKTEIDIKGEPNINYEMREYWAAFWDLNDFRPVNGQGLTPIPKHDILTYASEHFYDEEEQVNFVSIIKIMDLEYRKTHYDKMEARIAQEKAKHPSSRRRR